jgi:hypothetical protein
MKIPPRLVGGSGAVRRAVLQLLGWARSGKPFVSEDDARPVLDEWIDLGYLAEWLGDTLRLGGWSIADKAIPHRSNERIFDWRVAASEAVLVGVLRGENGGSI